MEKSIRLKNKNSLEAMTLVEVLVALAIVSFVFSSLTAMAFDALARTKKLELQDQMRTYASDASEIIYNTKNTSWKSLNEVLPQTLSETNKSTAYIDGEDLNNKLVKGSNFDCKYDSSKNILFGNDCKRTLPTPEKGAQLFGRIIVRNDTVTQSLDNEADISVIIACLEEECDSSDFKPFILDLKIFRTGGTNE